MFNVCSKDGAFTMLRDRLKLAKSFGSFCFFILTVICLQISNLNAPTQREISRRERSEYAYNSNGASILGSMGFSNLLADRMWLGFIQYFGDFESRQRFGYDLSGVMLSSIVDQDPYFIDAYMYATLAHAWKQAKPQDAIDFLKRGAFSIYPHVNPNAYRLWYQIALVEALWIGDARSAQLAFNKTAEWIEVLTSKQKEQAGIILNPASLRALGERFTVSPRSRQVRFDIWVQVLQELSSPDSQQLALSQIDALGGLERLPSGEIRLIRPSNEE